VGRKGEGKGEDLREIGRIWVRGEVRKEGFEARGLESISSRERCGMGMDGGVL
jgi:hypothetical protein